MKIAIAQLNSSSDLEMNLSTVSKFTAQAAKQGAKAVLFPENTLYMGSQRNLWTVARRLSPIVRKTFPTLAENHRIAILLGSYPETQKGSKRVFNTSLWINERGIILGKYRKIHLFDVKTPRGSMISESSFVAAGKKPVLFSWKGITFCMSICFDLRFPEYYRSLSKKGAEVLLIPSAFTKETGQAHWHTLLRSRSIENQAIVLAPAQGGTHSQGRKTYGHALAYDAWGNLLGERKSKTPGLVYVSLQTQSLRKLRKRFPVWPL